MSNVVVIREDDVRVVVSDQGRPGADGTDGTNGANGSPGAPGLSSVPWAASTVYVAGVIVTENGGLFQAPSGGVPSRSTFTIGDWTVLSPPNGTYVPIASATLPGIAPQEYWVSSGTKGSDSNSGDKYSPFATVAHAQTVGVATGSPFTIRLGYGNFAGSTTISLVVGMSIWGAGQGMSTISYSDTGDIVKFLVGAPNSLTQWNGSLIDVNFDATNAGNLGACVDIVGAQVGAIERCAFNGSPLWGAIFDQSELITFEKNNLQLTSTNTLGGVWCVNGNDHIAGNTTTKLTTTISVHDNNFNMGANAYSVVDDGGESHRYRNNSFNGGVGYMRLAGCPTVMVKGNDMEGATGDGIVLASTTLQSATSVNACNMVSLFDNFVSGAGHYVRADSVLSVVTSGNFWVTPSSGKFAFQFMADIQSFVSINDAGAATGSQYCNGNATYDVRIGNGLLRFGPLAGVSATEGFLSLPTVAGTPTGVPVAGQGSKVWDTTVGQEWGYGPGGWQVGAPMQARYVALTATGQTFVVPAGITKIRVRLTGSGGGAAGGSSAATSATAQTGGGGAAAGVVYDNEITVVPGHTLTGTVPAAGGTGGAGGISGGGQGGQGNSGGQTVLVDTTASTTLAQAAGGTGGKAPAASGTATGNGGLYSSNFNGTSASSPDSPGSGGAATSTAHSSGAPFASVVGGGAGGAAAAAGNGGSGGQAAQAGASMTYQNDGANAGSGSANGANGTTATAPGCGGGGGGGATGSTGVGGIGGTGGPGLIEIWY